MEDQTSKGATTDIAEGLTTEEARRRLTEYGYNEVPEKKANPFLRFAAKLWLDSLDA